MLLFIWGMEMRVLMLNGKLTYVGIGVILISSISFIVFCAMSLRLYAMCASGAFGIGMGIALMGIYRRILLIHYRKGDVNLPISKGQPGMMRLG